jgi:acyl-CoA synthetase (AMP-forming)/AMP-acid ligase II
VDVKIVSTETLQALTEENAGEIWIRSDSKPRGYYKKPEISNRDFFAEIDVEHNSEQSDNSVDPKRGYLRTDDIGFLHNNEIFVC